MAITFWVLSFVAVFSAIMVITSERPITSGLFLLLSFVAVAGLYVTLSAPFIAAMQLVVYSGAIIVLILLLAGAFLFYGGVSQKAAAYNKLYEAREQFLEDPVAWRENRLEERRKAQAEAQKAREEAEKAKAAAEAGGEGEASAGEGQQQRGGGADPRAGGQQQRTGRPSVA